MCIFLFKTSFKCTQLFCVHVNFYISSVMLLISSSGLLFALGTVFKIHPLALCTEYSVASGLRVLCGGHQPYPRCVCSVLCWWQALNMGYRIPYSNSAR